ncbi:MAG: hypothetical protein V4670_07230 [Bacteroidota bacterium]
MKTKIIFCLLLLQQILFSQEKINTFSYEINKPKSVVTLSDELNEKVIFIYDYKTNTDFLLFDENMNPKGKISETFTEKEKKDYLGYSVSDNKYYIYWERENIIEVKELDFETSSIKTSQLNFVLEKKEKFLSKFSNNGKFYILTSTKETKILNIYCLENNAIIKKAIDFKAFRFMNSIGSSINFHDLCWEHNGTVFTDGFRIMSNNSFPSLVTSTQKKKIYIQNDTLILAFDENPSFTQVLLINLNDYSTIHKVFDKPYLVWDNQFVTIDSNSYIINNHVFQIKKADGKIYISIKDFENNEIKNIAYQIDNFGKFFNSDFIQEEGSFTKKTILEKPNQFIRRASEQNPAINGFYEDNKYQIDLGGVSYPQQNNGALIGGMIGGLAGSLVGTLIAGNPSNLAINSYANRRVLHLKLILDKDFNHLAEKAPNSKLENLRSFIETEKDQDFNLIYSLKNKLYLTSYDKKLKQTVFYKF